MTGVAEIEIYARFCETDAAGHINNTSYFLYIEEARTKFFKEIGFSGKDRRGNIDFIVVSTSCDFKAQAYAGQTLKVRTAVCRIGSKSFTLSHAIHDAASDTPVAKGEATIVCFNYAEQRSQAIPPLLKELLEARSVPA